MQNAVGHALGRSSIIVTGFADDRIIRLGELVAAPIKRDLEQTKERLAQWLTPRVAPDRIEITNLSAPSAGTSSDTLLLEGKLHGPSGSRNVRWVLRIQARTIQIYQDPSVEKQFRVMERLGRATRVPVPRALWFEANDEVLGAPFFVMEHVQGRVPTNYNAPGWLADLAPAARERLWLNAIETLAGLHATDVSVVDFLNRPDLGPTGLDQELAVWNGYFEWSQVPKHATLLRAQQWLEDHAPKEKPTGLAWGDAQLSNMIFAGERCVAVIDWETVSLGGAEEDLSWWLVFDDFYSRMAGLTRLSGLGDRAATIAAWEQFAGRKLVAMEWHEVFATWRVAMISERAMAVYAANGTPIPGISSGDGNPYVVRLTQLLAER